VGIAMTINFVLFWAIPIFGMGYIWRNGLKKYILPLYDLMNDNKAVRAFAANYIYTRPEHADFFVNSLFSLLNSIFFSSLVFYWQLNYGSVPMWLTFLYYCSWVGIGGRNMGLIYTMAHKEGHNKFLYKKWIKDSIGNIFENWLGVLFGMVPWNFTTNHIAIHHKLNGGCGDTFYMWDLDRTSIPDFMLYLHRSLIMMSGFSSLHYFNAHGLKDKADLLRNGIITYWITAIAFLTLTRSFSFVFFFYVQPLLFFSFFIGFINVAYHAFVEYDHDGKSIPYVNSTTIVDGEDDYFGEDDHMAHHYHTGVYYRELPNHRASKAEDFKRVRASKFRGLSSPEMAGLLLFNMWDVLADHYVDYSGEMTREEVKSMLKARAQRTELTYEEYAHYLSNPTEEERKRCCALIETRFGPRSKETSKQE
jgi:hypothetical protein